MDIASALKKYNGVEIELLLQQLLGKTKEFLFMHPQTKISPAQIKKLEQWVKRRRAGEPIAYILGSKNFLGRPFLVNHNVLIPRPETEWLVEHAVKRIAEKFPTGAKVLDVGTGSGCIAISLALAMKTNNYLAKILASDISPQALTVAKKNARRLDAQIKFYRSDLLKEIPGGLDAIVANLPYVPAKMLRKFLLHKPARPAFSDPFASLAWEPAFALTDGTSSWQIYKRFLAEARGKLTPGGIIFLEIDPSQRKSLKEMVNKFFPQASIKFYRDFRQLWRFAEITTKNPG